MNAFPVTAALLLTLFTGAVQAAPVPSLDNDPVGYLRYVQTSPDAAAVAARREIAGGPVALARERAGAQKEGLAVFPAQLNRSLPPPDQNAAPLYVKVAALRRGRVRLPNYAETLSARYAYTPAQLERVQKIYDDNPDVFALLRQATEKPVCVFVRDWTKDAMNPPFTEFAGLRESAREIKTESVLLAEEGRYAEAVTTQARGYRLAEHAASDGTLISYLVAQAMDAIATSGMGDILTLAGPNADVAALVTQAITERGAHLSLRRGLSGEIALQDAEFALLRRDDARGLQILFDNSVPISSLPRARFTPDERQAYLNLLDAAEADLISRMRRGVAAADTPAGDAAFAQATRDATAQTSEPVRMVSDKLSPLQFGMLNVLPARGAASRAVVQAAAAVLSQRAKTGTYPDALPQPSPDPFTGKPLGYRREGTDGFVVYSAGPDGTFSGGQPGDKTPPGAVLFRYPAPAAPVPQDVLK